MYIPTRKGCTVVTLGCFCLVYGGRISRRQHGRWVCDIPILFLLLPVLVLSSDSSLPILSALLILMFAVVSPVMTKH